MSKRDGAFSTNTTQGPTENSHLPQRLLDAIRQANLEVYQKNREQPEGRQMTTTVVAAVVQGAACSWRTLVTAAPT